MKPSAVKSHKLHTILRSLLATTLVVSTFPFAVLSGAMSSPAEIARAARQVCGAPGKDGPGPIQGVISRYFRAGRETAPAGSVQIEVGPSNSTTSPVVEPGDLLLVIQMQGADIDASNNEGYGDGLIEGGAFITDELATGYLVNTNLQVGYYEYVVAQNNIPNTGGTLNITPPLANTYYASAETPTTGRRAFQVVRVPQYSSVTIGGELTIDPWNGDIGGVLAMDVAGSLNLNGQSINVSGMGFRGGGGQRSNAGFPGLADSDYRSVFNTFTPTLDLLGPPNTRGATPNGSKGEGIAGTPRLVFDWQNNAIVQTIPITEAPRNGYPNGDFARGAPGNAGGGGTDANPEGRGSYRGAWPNDQNSGGGGGGNGQAGGITGGYSWFSSLARGGFGGSRYAQLSPNQFVLGGGGGAGSVDDNDPRDSSGGAGGGIIIGRVSGGIVGPGTIRADGRTAPDQPLNDGSGGGGAGGSILFLANQLMPASVTFSAQGGKGGNNNGDNPNDPNRPHGPGGGGGGGVIYISAGSAIATVSGGANGVTYQNDGTPISFGAVPGEAGKIRDDLTLTETTGIITTEGCMPQLIVTKNTSTPITTPGGTATYSIVVQNKIDVGTAYSVTVSDVLPAGFSYASGAVAALGGGATGPNAPANTGTASIFRLANTHCPAAGWSRLRLASTSLAMQRRVCIRTRPTCRISTRRVG